MSEKEVVEERVRGKKKGLGKVRLGRKEGKDSEKESKKERRSKKKEKEVRKGV
jgi:hypothetical protein